MTTNRKALDTQLIELAGRNWLASTLQRAGIEVARPERDRGVDLIAYVDRDRRVSRFVACPIQMKAATEASFSLYPRYSDFPGIFLAYVWYLGRPAETKSYALTYDEALRVAKQMGWTKTSSWLHGGKGRMRGYSTTKPPERLRSLLAAYEMNSDGWWLKVNGSVV